MNNDYNLNTVNIYSEDTIWAYPDLTHAKELMKGMIK
jgi:hypothetical protein